MQTNKSWLSEERKVTKDYFNNGLRLSVDCDGNKTCIRKTKLHTLDFRFEDTPFDVRVCFSKETPIPVSEFKLNKKMFSRDKDRMSYKHKCWFYDITNVKTVYNTVEESNYEFELECNVSDALKVMKPFHVVHSSLLKIKDIVNMCETVTDEAKLEIL